MADKQGDLRDELCAVMMTHLERQDVNLVQAATAALGACAVALGALPQPGRERAAEALSAVLLDHANRRAAELRRGSHDDRCPRTNRGQH